MSLLFIDGFDHYADGDIAKKYSAEAYGALRAGYGRRGGNAWYQSNGYGYARKAIPSSATIIAGFAWQPTANGADFNIIAFNTRDGSNNIQVCLCYNSANKLEARASGRSGTLYGTSADPLTLSSFVYVEIKIYHHASAGTVEVRVDGVAVITATGLNTGAAVSSVELGCNDYSAPYIHICDYYVCNDAGSVNNDFLGDCRVDTLFPTSDGAYGEFTPSAGADHYALVDEATPSLSDFVYSSTVGHRDTYGFGDLTGLASPEVKGVQVVGDVLKSDAGSLSVATMVRSGTTDEVGATYAPSTTELFLPQIFETDPNTASAWTESAVNALEAGLKVTA